MLRSLLGRPLLIGRRRDTAALLLRLTQDARRPRLGMVPDTATARSNRDRSRRRRRRSSRVFEIVEQVVELAVPFSVAAERRRARLQRRHRPCPSVAQDASKEGGGSANANRCAHRARAPSLRFLGRPEIGEYLALTHPLPLLGNHARFLPSARRECAVCHISPVRYVCPCLSERFASCQQ